MSRRDGHHRDGHKSTRRTLDLRYLATFRSSAHRPHRSHRSHHSDQKESPRQEAHNLAKQENQEPVSRTQVHTPPNGLEAFAQELQKEAPPPLRHVAQPQQRVQFAPWSHFVFATSAEVQPCFDEFDNPVEGAELDLDERVMLFVDQNQYRTTRVTTEGGLVTTRVDKNKFKDFQPLP